MTTATADFAAPAANTDIAARIAAPLGRTLVASLFFMSGVSKITQYEGTQAYMESVGVPGGLLPAAIAFEILAPLALVFGFRARFAAFFLAGFSVVTAFLFHADFSNQIQQIMFLKNISIAGGLLMIAAAGAGAFSLDARSK